MNKEAVLPYCSDKRGVYFQGQSVQRDADWERIKPLLEAVNQVVGCREPEHGDPLPCSRCVGKLVNAYKQLVGEQP